MAIRTPLTNIEEYLDNHGVNPRELPRNLDVLVSYIDKLEKRIESLEGDHKIINREDKEVTNAC